MLSAGMHAVDMPPRTIVPLYGRRWYRFIVGPAGLLLFLTMFVPAPAYDPIVPAEVPLAWPPYLLGLLLALAAAVHTERGLRRVLDLSRVVTILTLAAASLLACLWPPLGLIAMIPPALCLGCLGLRGANERRAAVATTMIGILCTMLFWPLGIYASAIGSIGLCIGGLVWLSEASQLRVVLPTARARN